MIGGFGNLAGEVDIWSLEGHKEIGKTKAYCTVGVHWAPNGKHVLSSVLYERVKVDNEVRIYNATGQLVCSESFKQSELYEAHWQPYPEGALPRPDIKQLEAEKKLEEAKNPPAEKAPAKKWFNPAGGSNTFAQIMRQEMSKTHEKGAKKVD